MLPPFLYFFKGSFLARLLLLHKYPKITSINEKNWNGYVKIGIKKHHFETNEVFSIITYY